MTNTHDQIEWITRDEARVIAGVSQRTIDSMLADGRLTKNKDGMGRVWIDAAELRSQLTPRPAGAAVR